VNEHERHIHRIFTEIESRERLSQRSLARELGIALGLTNLLVRDLVRKGWVKAVRIRPNQVRYLLTPRGMLKKARLSREYLRNSIKFYAETRDRIRGSFAILSAEWPPNGGGPVEKRIVFYGTGDVAEIGYLCLQETDLSLVGVIDDCGRRQFFGLPLQSPGDGDGTLRSLGFDKIVVMSFEEKHGIRRKLEMLGITASRVFWI